MHELALTESILRIAVEAAKENQAQKVLEIRIKIGAYSGVVPQYIQEYFNIVSRGSIAENAHLLIEMIPARVECGSCGAVTEVERFRSKCGACGSTDVKLLSGREYYVDSLEVE
ncbi:MAG: hydrogenase maturation nickel metallochaperone HypA [Bacillota bacterium]|nr:hydrogenase maturation nickel metallochaperone HypA [Bacillota bacterium]